MLQLIQFLFNEINQLLLFNIWKGKNSEILNFANYSGTYTSWVKVNETNQMSLYLEDKNVEKTFGNVE